MPFTGSPVVVPLLAIGTLLLCGTTGAQAPAASAPGQETRFTPPPPPARHEPATSGPFAGLMSGSLYPKGSNETRFVGFSAFRGLRGCAHDEFTAVRLAVAGVREEGCLLLAASDRQTIQVRWADGRVERYTEADWTLRTHSR